MKACVRQSCHLLYVYTNFGCIHSPIHSPIQIQKRVDATVMLLTLVCLKIVSNTRMLFSEISTQHALIGYNTHRGSQGAERRGRQIYL